jgi:hypothetical protein
MKKLGLLGVLMVLVGILGIVAVAQEQVHLGWSVNDVYTTMTVCWWSEAQEGQVVVYDTEAHELPVEYVYYKEGTANQIKPEQDVFGNPIETVFGGYYYQAELTGLEPGAVYSFRVGGVNGFTREWSFRTIGRDEEVKFVFGGDSRRPYGDGYEVKKSPASPMNWPYARDFVTQAAAEEDPAFIIFGGDMIGDGNSQEQWANWMNAWQEYAVTEEGRMIPVVAFPGNHEMSAYPNVEASYEWYQGQFATPGLYYSLDFPNLHLTVLLATFKQTSSGGAWPLATEEAESQVEWLVKDLQSSAPWKLVLFHVNYFGCFASGSGYPCEPYTKVWTSYFEENDVDIVIMGHTHNYTRSWPLLVTGFEETDKPSVKALYELQNSSEDGITYIVQGGWGANPDILAVKGYCNVQDYLAAAMAHPSFSVATVTEYELHIVTKDTAGDVFDDITFPFITEDFPVPEYEQVIR